VLSSDCTGRLRFWDLRKAGVVSAVATTADDSFSVLRGGKADRNVVVSSASKSLKVVEAHKHWVTGAQYNPAHDQLVLTCSTDQHVRLWRISSISSAPLMELDDAELALSSASVSASGDSDDDGNSDSSNTSGFRFPGGDRAAATAADVMVKDYTEHEDSVYDVAWSACESWVFASVSYAGRVIVSSVPSSEKYKILL
jgi:WD40 repeat protein